jgi:hypothetical protein
LLGTTPRVFRQFLRSPISTFVAVGSGSRYEFTEKDVPTIKRRFAEWNGAGKPKANPDTSVGPKQGKTKTKPANSSWEEEGPVVIADIRDPRVRRRVLAAARDAELRLEQLLLSKGLHVTQRGDRHAS